MIDIDLLPPEYGPKKLVSPYNLAVIGILSIMAVSLIFSSIRLISTVQLYSERIQYYDEQIRSYRPQVEDIRELSIKVKLLKTRLSLVQELLKEKSDLSDRLNDLYQCIPNNDVWVDKITVEHRKTAAQNIPGQRAGVEKPDNQPGQKAQEPEEKDIIQFNITGVAVSVDNISHFIANLEDSKIFENVVFNSTIKDVKTPSGKDLMAFSFAVEIAEPKFEL